MKGGPLAGFAIHPYRPAHHLDKLLDDEKTQPRSTVDLLDGCIDLAKVLEKPLPLIRRDARAGIAHRKGKRNTSL